MRFSELIAPLSTESFLLHHYDRQPLHIPAPEGSERDSLLSWQRMNELLAIQSHWTEGNLKLIMNSRAVFPDFYLDEVDTPEGPVRRAAPAKVDVFLSMGASLVANSVEAIAPEVRALTSAVGEFFSARVGANVYCSFQDVQAFGSHCDLHEVFALQCEGEKVWRIYRNRAASPVEALEGDDAQKIIDSAKGPVLLEVRMRPGDVLYIPRGFYHDAVASGDASLHITLSVAPLTGRILFRLLEDEAIKQQIFRDYLPDARVDGGRALSERLQQLALTLSDLVRSQSVAQQVKQRQRKLWSREFHFHLPERQKLDFYARTDRPAELRPHEDGLLLLASGTQFPLGHLSALAQYLFERPAFVVQELLARYPHLDAREVSGLVERLEQIGLFTAYTPET